MRSLILILLIFVSTSLFSQQVPNIISSVNNTEVVDSNDTDSIISYPIVTLDSMGNKILILTIEQVRVIDNKLNILELLRQSNNLSENIDSVCIRVINEKNQVIANQDIQISKLDSLVSNKDDQIENLKMQIDAQLAIQSTFRMELDNKNKEINLHLERIDDLEKKVLWGGVGGGLAITILTALLLVK